MKGMICAVASCYTGWVKEETGANDGPWVEAIQRVTGNRRGDPWCASFVAFVLGIAYRGKSPYPATASCDTLLTFARSKSWEIPATEATAGDIFLVMAKGSATDAIHTGIVKMVAGDVCHTIEGNTNPGGSRDGYGVFERTRAVAGLRFLRVP